MHHCKGHEEEGANQDKETAISSVFERINTHQEFVEEEDGGRGRKTKKNIKERVSVVFMAFFSLPLFWRLLVFPLSLSLCFCVLFALDKQGHYATRERERGRERKKVLLYCCNTVASFALACTHMQVSIAFTRPLDLVGSVRMIARPPTPTPQRERKTKKQKG